MTGEELQSLEVAQEQQRLAEARLATIRANVERQQLESVLTESVPQYATGNPYVWSQPNDLYGDSPQSYQAWATINYCTAIDDRENERFRPYYLNEDDLRRKRAEWRNIAAFASVAIGANESRKNYVLGEGFSFEVTSDVDGTDEVRAKAQLVVDQFVEDNEFYGVLDTELFNRVSEDGEAFVAIYPNDGWRSVARIVEPDQVTEPMDPEPIERWLDCSGVSYWWHGVHTKAIQIGRHAWMDNTANPLGYHVIYDSIGEMWDYVPVERMQHFKANTPMNARRGVSDYMPVLRDIEIESRLRRNTSEGAAIQAAIAFIREHAPGTSPSSLESFAQNTRTGSYTKTTADGSQTTHTRKYNSGTILDIAAGLKYHAGPLGANQSPIFMEVASYILRSIGIRWSMPEYIISGDASNAAFASTLVAESPFVKAREREQQFYCRHYKTLLWKVLQIAWQNGFFGGLSWDELQNSISIEVEAPDVSTRNRLENAREKQLLSQAKIISRRTWANEAGYDYDEEQKRIAEEPEVMPAIPGFESRSRLDAASRLMWEGYP